MRTFIRQTGLEKTLKHLSLFQGRAMRNILDANPVFHDLTPSQKLQLFQIVEPVSLPRNKNSVLIREDETPEACYFIHTGRVTAMRRGRRVSELASGSLFGIRPVLNSPARSDYTFAVRPDTVLYRFESRAMQAFVQNNPGVFLKLCNEPF
jgi:CRP-like cAMP-binding protein